MSNSNPTEPERVDLQSANPNDERLGALRDLYPEAFADGKIDFERLRLALGDDVDTGKERYGLNWPGKAEAYKAVQIPSIGTLIPDPEESVNWDTTDNVIIEGDNLEVLKLLQKAYHSKVNLIIIDPPYNTGGEFIYPDNFKEGLREYLEFSKQILEGRSLATTNSETSGRYHSAWLSMILPRLVCAKSLLAQGGILACFIDDTEVQNLKLVLNEVFGEENFLAHIVWQKRYVSNATAKHISDMHDHILCFAKNIESATVALIDRTEEQIADYKNPDSDSRGVWRAQDLSASKPYSAGLFEITGPTGLKFSPPPGRYWRCSIEQYTEWLEDNRIWFGVNNTGRPMLKAFLTEVQQGIKANTWWDHEFAGHNKEATLHIKKLFDGDPPFDTPKTGPGLQTFARAFHGKSRLSFGLLCGLRDIGRGSS